MASTQRAWEILRKEGVIELVKRAARYIYNNSMRKVAYPAAKWQFLRAGRSPDDIKWLFDNKRDRQDALLQSIMGVYKPDRSRAEHYYRYVLAAELVSINSPRVLDIASGTGYGSDVISSRLQNCTYIGCEISSEAVEYAIRNYRDGGYIRADARSMPFRSGSIDVIVSFETMEHIPDLESYLSELQRVSNDSGEIFVSVPFKEELNPNREQNSKQYPHIHRFNYDKFNTILSEFFLDSKIEYYSQELPSEIHSPESAEIPLAGISKIPREKEPTKAKSIIAHIVR
jgi:ubiquinone/menaquinone biosynthesis C-methylase UbiE